jgi:Ser/Thr protein kinase RdoA (MazF antagonist)
MTTLWNALTPDAVLNTVEKVCGERLTNLCLPRNSYINRVFELEYSDSRERLIVKFYRPNRWTPAQIAEEHSLIQTLYEQELPVIPALSFGGKTVFTFESIPFALFPKKGGRAIDELSQESWEQIGRLLGRMHAITATLKASKRIVWSPKTASVAHLETLLKSNTIPKDYVDSVTATATRFITQISPKFETLKTRLIHGDCHLGNLIYRPGEALHLVDFDDCAVGPVLQDLWMLLPGTPEECPKELAWFKSGYTLFSDFPESQLALIPALRGMRQLHFAAWCAIQVGEPQFSASFPEWGTPRYWNDWVRSLMSVLV